MKIVNHCVQYFLNKGRVIQYKKGQVIIRPEDTPQGVFFLYDGYVRKYSMGIEGEEKLIAIDKAGCIFPLTWVLKNIEENIYYETLSESIVYRVPKNDFLKFIKSDSSACLELIHSLALLFSNLTDHIIIFGSSKSYVRLVMALLVIAKDFGETNKNQMTSQFPLTQTIIASFLMATRETVSKGMIILKKKGIVSYDKKRLIINDISKLKKELGN